MDGDKLIDRVYPPASSPPAQQNDNLSFPNMLDNENTGPFANATTVGENPVFFPPDQSSTTPLPWRQIHGNYQTYPYAPIDIGNNLAVDLNQPPNFQYPTCIAGNVPNFYQHNYPHPQRDNLMNVQPQFSGFRNPRLYRNSSHNIGNAREVIDLTLDDGNEPNMNNFYGPGGGKNVLYNSQDSEVTSNYNQNQINAAQFGSSRRVDGSFLSLGDGCRSTDVTNPDFINRSAILERRPANSAPHFGGFSDYRNNMGGLPSSQNNMGGLPNFQNNIGELPNYQNSMGGLPNYQNSVGGLPNSQNIMGGLPNYQNSVGGLPSSQNIMGGLPNFQSNVGGLPNSQKNMGRLPNSQINLGVFPSVRNKMGDLHNSINDAGTMSSAGYVQRRQANKEHGFSIPSNSNLGYMPNVDTRYATADPYDVLRDRLHTPSGQFSNSSNEFSRPVQIGVPNPPPGFPTLDPAQQPYQEYLQNQLARNLSYSRHIGSLVNRGYSGQVPNPRNDVAQSGNETAQLLMRRSNQLAGRMVPNPENYGHLQVSNRHGNPSLKRGMIHPNPSAPRVQRRRTMAQYPSSQYGPPRPQTPPASSIHIPTHRGGSGGVLKPSGHKCMICKRDLVFSPEGPIQQPSIPPVVAVLPCQHTFHDHCLQLITTEDEKTNPPCIPCAMGEK